MTNEEIKTLRLKLGLSQYGFADLVGVSVSTVCRWESGKRNPLPIANKSLETIAKRAAKKAK